MFVRTETAAGLAGRVFPFSYDGPTWEGDGKGWVIPKGLGPLVHYDWAPREVLSPKAGPGAPCAEPGSRRDLQGMGYGQTSSQWESQTL